MSAVRARRFPSIETLWGAPNVHLSHLTGTNGEGPNAPTLRTGQRCARRRDHMHHLTLTPDDNAELFSALGDLAKAYDTIENPELIRRAPVLARTLPVHLIEFLEEFRLSEPSALCVVSGLDVDEADLGPTPEHWRDSQFGSRALTQEIF